MFLVSHIHFHVPLTWVQWVLSIAVAALGLLAMAGAGSGDARVQMVASSDGESAEAGEGRQAATPAGNDAMARGAAGWTPAERLSPPTAR